MTPASKAVLITGASTGIGYELAKLFAQEGHKLVLLARNDARLSGVAGELARAYGVSVRTIAKDLALPGAAAEVYQELKRDGVAVDVLVNNAGFGAFGRFDSTDLDAEVAMMELNIVSLTRLTKLFLRDMLAKGEGKILNVASTAAFQPGPLMAVYYATKAYVLSFSEALASEVAGSGVIVSVLCPGPTRTEFQHRARMGDSKVFDWGSMDAAAVARIGYRGLMKGKTVIIPGCTNRLLALSVRFLPRSLVTSVIRALQERRATFSHQALKESPR